MYTQEGSDTWVCRTAADMIKWWSLRFQLFFHWLIFQLAYNVLLQIELGFPAWRFVKNWNLFCRIIDRFLFVKALKSLFFSVQVNLRKLVAFAFLFFFFSMICVCVVFCDWFIVVLMTLNYLKLHYMIAWLKKKKSPKARDHLNGSFKSNHRPDYWLQSSCALRLSSTNSLLLCTSVMSAIEITALSLPSQPPGLHGSDNRNGKPW